jgi:hypothetical protein
VDKLLPPLIGLIQFLTSSFEWLHSILGPVYQAIKPVLDGLLAITGIKNSDLTKTVTVSTAISGADRRLIERLDLGKTTSTLKRVAAPIGIASGSGGLGSSSSFNAELEKLNREAEKAAKEANDAMAKIEAEAQAERKRAADAEQAILDKRQDAYKSFTDSVKQLFGQIKDSIMSSFTLPTLGNSVNSITRNISKLLERTKGFANSISRLSGMGLNSALLQQVIQAGPMQGSQLAAALVGGGAGFITQLNRAYGEFGDLAGGIAGVGTTGAFAGQQTINNYSIEVTGGLATGSDVGRAVVNAIKDYERQSGAAWRG